MKILLLEDNKQLSQLIKRRLSLKDYTIDCFEDGEKAYESIIDNNYNCFILDINVPTLNGVELLKKIRVFYEYIPVIIMSATVELSTIKEAYGFGCNEFLKKPFFVDELEIKIKKLCNINENVIYFDANSYFDYQSSSVMIYENHFHLTKKEKLLINLLLDRRDTVVSFECIEEHVWEGKKVSLDSIRSLVRRIRKIIPGDYIEVVINVGYIFKINKSH